MAVAQIAAMVTTAADAIQFERLASLSGWVTHLSVRGLLGSAALVDWAPWLTWRVPSPLLVVVVTYYLAVVIGVRVQSSSARRVAVAIACVLFGWMAIAPPTLARRFGDGRLHLTMMDVGQGDAMLVTFPNGRTLLVDAGGVSTGGGFDVGDRVLGPALRHRGIGRLDYLAITHGDLDHIGGASALARDFRPAEVWYGTFVNNHEPTERLRATADRTRAGWRTLLANDRIEIGGVELRVHHPPLPDWQRQKVRNDDSLVIELRFGQVSMLLTGDIGVGCRAAAARFARSAADRGAEISASWQRHVELGPVHRRDQTGAGVDQLRPRQSIRTPGAARARAVQGDRRRGVTDRSSRTD